MKRTLFIFVPLAAIALTATFVIHSNIQANKSNHSQIIQHQTQSDQSQTPGNSDTVYRTFDNGIEISLSDTEEGSIQVIELQHKIADTDTKKLYLVNYTKGTIAEIGEIEGQDEIEIPITESGIYGVIAKGEEDTVDLTDEAQIGVGSTAVDEQFSNIQFCGEEK